ncbi:gamma carbonic anhydrase family protein [Rhizobium tubonense]|uniref:Transferase n=1 Tax=Rhizobium tubonense TaxID=484088 RepID=A0A2W4CMP1_9HYPH|nr:gamma carbonic anhydrase family protein [Rhizobium tubonense]PZM12188.1 transferase [Rhizobium tubonense]
MLAAYDDKKPVIDPGAWVADDATVCGDVTIGPGCRVMPGARIVAEAGGAIRIGACCIVLENAVIRSTARHATSIGDHCLVGPNSHIVGATIGDEVFVATGASIFHGATVGAGSEVRINAVVHLRTELKPGATVPIGWIAVGNPAQFFSADRHEEIWALQQPLDFPGFVYGVDRGAPDLMRTAMETLSKSLAIHHRTVAIES